MLLGTLGTSLLGNLLTGWGVKIMSQGRRKSRGINSAGEGVLRSGYGNYKIDF